MIDPIILKSDTLFVKLPAKADQASIEAFYNTIKSDIVKAIDQTYFLIQSYKTTNEILQLWEIRLLLILFNNNLNQAKTEAINLNNVLYVSENVDALALLPIEPGTIHPLPRNNNGDINHHLLILLLRLKSNPNMALINDFYKLCYQMRLKSSPNLSVNLVNLSFDIIVILLINKNYFTLINFVKSLIHDIDTSPRKEYENVTSNLKLILIIVIIQVLDSNKLDDISIRSQIGQYSTMFDTIDISSKAALVYVLNTVSSVSATTTEKIIDKFDTDLSLTNIIDMVLNGNISHRIVCCTLGLWDLMNCYNFQLSPDLELKPPSKSITSPDLIDCFYLVTNQWCYHIQKVYGLE